MVAPIQDAAIHALIKELAENSALKEVNDKLYLAERFKKIKILRDAEKHHNKSKKHANHVNQELDRERIAAQQELIAAAAQEKPLMEKEKEPHKDSSLIYHGDNELIMKLTHAYEEPLTEELKKTHTESFGHILDKIAKDRKLEDSHAELEHLKLDLDKPVVYAKDHMKATMLDGSVLRYGKDATLTYHLPRPEPKASKSKERELLELQRLGEYAAALMLLKHLKPGSNHSNRFTMFKPEPLVLPAIDRSNARSHEVAVRNRMIVTMFNFGLPLHEGGVKILPVTVKKLLQEEELQRLHSGYKR